MGSSCAVFRGRLRREDELYRKRASPRSRASGEAVGVLVCLVGHPGPPAQGVERLDEPSTESPNDAELAAMRRIVLLGLMSVGLADVLFGANKLARERRLFRAGRLEKPNRVKFNIGEDRGHVGLSPRRCGHGLRRAVSSFGQASTAAYPPLSAEVRSRPNREHRNHPTA